MARKPKDGEGPDSYERHRRRAAQRQAEQSAEGRDIGPIPKPKHARRRKACDKNFRKFCETYFPRAFPIAWSDDHLKVIKAIERTVLVGGLQAIAMPRGSGKTTLCERAIIWAVLYGHHRYGFLVCADDGKARKCLEKIKTELEANDALLSDFPEAIYPIRKLERISNRAKAQSAEGEPTLIQWNTSSVVFPTIPESPCSGSILGVGGITSAVRGAAHTLPDGTVLRPSLVLIDDPQTRESAKSHSQCETREQIVSADILGMAGPDEQIACLMPCTVIYPGDMADRLLDRELHPDWRGIRTKSLYAFPTQMKLWEEYDQLRREELRNDGDGRQARNFYKRRKKKMDAGAKVAWPECKAGRLSGLQFQMDRYFRDPIAFASEYQNEPEDATLGDDELLTPDEIAAKVSPLGRGKVPLEASTLTAMIDVQQDVLFWLAAAWRDDFTGWVLDYGAWPDQGGRKYFTLRQIRPTLRKKYRGAGLEGALYRGLVDLTEELLARNWQREDGAELAIDRCLIDANWEQSTDVVYQVCRQSAQRGRLMPSHGRGITAGALPMAEYKKKPGDVIGRHWRVPAIKGKPRLARYVLYDTNFYKSFVHERLSVGLGDRGALSLFKAAPSTHRMLADHLTAEYRVKTEGRGRELWEWKLRPERPDNHLLDCLVGTAVAASMQGCVLNVAGGRQPAKPKRKKRKKVSYL